MRSVRLLALAIGVCIAASHVALAADAPASKAATVADAIKVLDLTSLPVFKGAEEPVNRTVGLLSYTAAGDCKAAFAFHQQGLLKQKWVEQPGTAVTDEYASGIFTKGGFACSVSATPLGQGKINISVILHGNVDLQKLPVPKGCKLTYGGPNYAMFSSDQSVEATAAECRKQLVANGWVSYGDAKPIYFFRQNAVRLSAMISEAPPQMGKTMINFSTEQLSAEIPAPADWVQLQYSDLTKDLLFDTKETEAAIDKFYRETLAKTGWKATTDKPFQIDFRRGLIFRNEAKDMLDIELNNVPDDNVLRVRVRHKSKAEVDAEEKAFQEAKAKNKTKPTPPSEKIKIAPPEKAEVSQSTPKRIEFKLAAGKGKAAAASIRKTLTTAGWKEKVTNDDGMVGLIDFEKGSQSISLRYIDPGFIPAEVSLDGSGIEFEKIEK